MGGWPGSGRAQRRVWMLPECCRPGRWLVHQWLSGQWGQELGSRQVAGRRAPPPLHLLTLPTHEGVMKQG